MATVAVEHLRKTFGPVVAVEDVSFTVEPGEIFGLLGPNGAGKTTTIRLILDIFRPEGGSIAVFGGPMEPAKKDRIGYMPEERGLYREVTLEHCLTYLGSLKGLSPAIVSERAAPLLDRFDLSSHKQKKVKALSKGMQQKAQIIVTILHQPDLIIIDEPFAGLDPVNTRLVKGLLRELRASGASIIMSTHMMHQVEELCDRLVLIDHGRVVLSGDLDTVRRQFSGNAVLVRSPAALPDIPGVSSARVENGVANLKLDEGIAPQKVLEELIAKGVPVDRFEIAVPTLDEIFVQLVAGTGEL